MNLIINQKRPVSSERTRVFAGDLVTMAKIQHILCTATEPFYLSPIRAAQLARFALDAGDLTSCALPAELVLAVAAIGFKAPHEIAASGVVGLMELCAGSSAFANARDIWLEHMHRSPDRRTPSVRKEHLEDETLAASLPPNEEEEDENERKRGEVIPFRGRDDLPDAG